jgi:hypothetical protein
MFSPTSSLRTNHEDTLAESRLAAATAELGAAQPIEVMRHFLVLMRQLTRTLCGGTSVFSRSRANPYAHTSARCQAFLAVLQVLGKVAPEYTIYGSSGGAMVRDRGGYEGPEEQLLTAYVELMLDEEVPVDVLLAARQQLIAAAAAAGAAATAATLAEPFVLSPPPPVTAVAVAAAVAMELDPVPSQLFPDPTTHTPTHTPTAGQPTTPLTTERPLTPTPHALTPTRSSLDLTPLIASPHAHPSTPTADPASASVPASEAASGPASATASEASSSRRNSVDMRLRPLREQLDGVLFQVCFSRQ